MNTINQLKSAGKNVFYGWWVVGAGSFLYALGIGSVFYGFNTFFNPMIAEFGWSRAVTSGAFSLARLEGGIEGPVVGWLIDKFGARKIAFVGIGLAGAGFLALTLVNSNVLSLYLIFGLLLAMGYNTGFFHPTTAAAANWFIKKRSRALSFITVGGGIGGAVIVPLLALLITQYGWRSAAVVMGLAMWVFGFPAAFLMRSRPEDKGLLPDGETMPEGPAVTAGPRGAESEGQSPAAAAGTGEVDFTVREALRTSAFWSLVVPIMLRACVLSGLVVHQIPHLVDMGFSYQAAAQVLGTMVLMSIPGRLIFGWIGDRFDKRRLLFISCLFQALGIWIFINAGNLGMVYLFVVLYGLGYGGSIPLTMGLRADLFGRRIFATIGGITVAITAVVSVAAPVLAGYLYDVTHSYRMAFYAFLVLISLSGFAFLLVRQPERPVRQR